MYHSAPSRTKRRTTRVALVSPRYPPATGGVERHVEALAAGLTRRGIAVDVVCTDPTGALPRSDESNGVAVRRFETLGHDDVFFVSPALARWLWREAGPYDIVHAHSYHTPVALAAAVAARRFDVPLVLTPHYHGSGHSPFRTLLHRPYRPFGATVVRGAAAVICVSEAERALIARDFGVARRTAVIPNGVDADRIRAAEPAPEDGRELVLAIGRLERYKRLDRLVKAAEHLPARFRVVVVGDGPERAGLMRLAESLGVANRVEFPGRVGETQLDAWLRRSSVVVSLSSAEAFGLTLLEGAAGGARVVASDIPAHRDVARYLHPSGVRFVALDARASDVAEAIQRAAEVAITQDDLSACLPTWDAMAGQVAEIYRRCLDRRMR